MTTKQSPAVVRGIELLSIAHNELPPLSLEFAKKLIKEVGILAP